MVTQAEQKEYLEEIRENVCSKCVERPPGGPPCEPLGKMCGVELHLASLIDSIHQVRSNRIQPYLEHNRQEICGTCAFLHSSFCPCPMDYLSVLVVQAVETVDERRRQRGETPLAAPAAAPFDLEEIRQVYRESSGRWTGCDWPTFTGKTGLNLEGWTAAQARVVAQETENPQHAEDWFLASHWLAQVEHHAQLAENRAAEAIKAAAEGRWRDALTNAEWAWSLEFATGRPLRHAAPQAWQRLRELIEAAYLAQEFAEVPLEGTHPKPGHFELPCFAGEDRDNRR